MKELLKLDALYKRVTILTVIALSCLGFISLYSVYLGNKNVSDFNKRIYVVNKNEQFEAIAANIQENRPVEIDYHVRRFHELFFSLTPDAESIEQNKKKYFFLCDESAKRLYEDLKEQNFYNDIIQGSIIQKITIDSVSERTDVYPYEVICYSRIFQTRASNSSEKSLITTCVLEDVPRSLNCPNGLLMRDFKVYSSKNIK